MIDNPSRILAALDRHLHAPFTLYVYGRSALALGYSAAPAAYRATMDVDAILPARELAAIEANEDFWQAQEQTNLELGDTGLYFTPLFEERQVILTPDWLEKTVALSGLGFRHLALRRPATADLVLTKMMRVDPQDREDIRFLTWQSDVTVEKVKNAVEQAILPDVVEIRQAFAENRIWLSTWLK